MDVDQIVDYIRNVYKQPETADRYREGLLATIRRLAYHSGSMPLSPYDFVRRRYGANARHVHYKKVTIIYTVKGDTVRIRRVIPGGLH
jgi:plasmid stabilization system protein ParE